MSIRHLFLPLLVAFAGAVSCDNLDIPDQGSEDTAGYVTVDQKEYCNLTSVTGKDSEWNQEWTFQDGENLRVKVSSWRCREEEHGHIGYYVTEVELELPDVVSIKFPLERTDGDNYISGNKGVSGAHLNSYKISDDGKSLEFDLSVTLYRDKDADIRVVWSGPVS